MDLIFALVLGTATPGGGFPVYGEAFADVVNAQEPRLRVQPRNTKGSTENVPLLEANKLDIALVAGEIASSALGKPDTPLRIVAAMYSSPGLADGAASWSYVLAKPALPEAAAYLLARALHRAEATFAARLEQARETTMANTVRAAPRPELIHPGVRRYLTEAGFR